MAAKDSTRCAHRSYPRENHRQAYDAWSSIKQRCFNPNTPWWHRYGGRGITMCPRWESFENFIADVGDPPAPGLQIDRINNDGNYEPGNVRWVTPKINSNNHPKRSVNRFPRAFVTIDGVCRSVQEWSELSGIPKRTIHGRLASGWPPHRMLEPPSLCRKYGTNGKKGARAPL